MEGATFQGSDLKVLATECLSTVLVGDFNGYL